jgi:molecular chaperone DnaK
MYAEQQAQNQPQQPQEEMRGGEQAKKDDGNVVDAEFTEVKDKKAG